MSYRMLQINELIQKELGQLIHENIDLPEGSICTITKIDTSKDLRLAKIWLSVFPLKFTKKVHKKLKGASGMLQSLLYKRLTLKPLPKLNFVVDSAEAETKKIEELLDKIKGEV